MLGHFTAGLRGLIFGGLLDEVGGQAGIRMDVRSQVRRPVREQTPAAEVAAKLRVKVVDLHAGVYRLAENTGTEGKSPGLGPNLF